MTSKTTKDTAATPEPTAPAKGSGIWYVLDSTATEQTGVRKHEQIVDGKIKTFSFEENKPQAMPAVIAMKFLRDPAFWRTDEKGNRLDYQRLPRQPEDLGAGEHLELAENETIARFEELTSSALLQRVVVLPGGEKFGLATEKPERADMIAFIIKANAEKRKLNSRTERLGPDDFTPDPELEDAA